MHEYSITPLESSEMHRDLLSTSKSKHVKSKSKHKHFKLFKKRNLNSKISKELKFADLSRFTPNRARVTKNNNYKLE